jgi:hypothetical protein
MENIQAKVDRIQEMQRQRELIQREKTKMYNVLCNCLRGKNNDYVDDIKTLDDFIKKRNFLTSRIWELSLSIPEDRKYIDEKFKGRIGKAKQEDRKKYLENLKDDEEELKKCEKLNELIFFDGAENKY